MERERPGTRGRVPLHRSISLTMDLKVAGNVGRFLSGLVLPVLAGLVFLCPPSNALATPHRISPITRIIPGDKVFLVYDSSEKAGHARNPLSSDVASAVTAMGFQTIYVDADKGLPSLTDLMGARAVITGFLDSSIRNAADYGRWVETVVGAGVRFIVIGNYGAFQDSVTGKAVSPELLGRAWNLLGVSYDAAWTADRYSIEYVDAALGTMAQVRPDQVKHFYQVSAVRDDVDVMVRARASGSPVASAVVFSSATGAMALSRYLSSDDWLASAASRRLDVAAFLQKALAHRPVQRGALLVIHDQDSSDAARAIKSLQVVSSYSGVSLYRLSLRDAAGLRPMDLAGYKGVLLAFSDVRAPLDGFIAGLLRAGMHNGLNVVAVLPVRNPVIGALIGLEIPESGVAGFKSSNITFLEGAFPGAAGLQADLADEGFSGMQVKVSDSCKVLVETVMSDSKDRYPLWWRCSAGSSLTGGLNSFEFSDRVNLGFLMQAVLDAEGFWAVAVPGAAVEFVDDCPLPMNGDSANNIEGRDTDFYVKTFYPHVSQLSKKYDLKTTFLGVFSYDDLVDSPYSPPYSGTTGSIVRELAHQIVSDNFAVGLHGSNHMSPSVDGGVTKHFRDRAALESWFAAGRSAFYQVFGSENKPVVFVPPNDWIDLAGRQALVAAVPEVRVIASVFSGSSEEYEHDFGRDPEVPSLVGLPRTWAGASLTGEPLLSMISGVMFLAVSTHFIHPDDIMDPARNFGLDWKGWAKALDSSMKTIKSRFPYLRNMSAVEAGNELVALESSGLSVSELSGRMIIKRASGLSGSTMLMLKTPFGCRPVITGGELKYSYPETGRHFAFMTDREMVLTCGTARGR